jgi:Xaa-Pro aminopeptidase
VLSPENFEYVAGVTGFPVTMWRRAGPASAVVTAGGNASFVIPETNLAAVQRANPSAATYSYPLWIEQVDVSRAPQGTIEERIAHATSGRLHRRPETYSQAELDDRLRAAVQQAGLDGKRVGIELEFAPAAHVEHLRALFPSIEFVNSSPLIRELRLIKTPAEIDLLRRAVRLTEAGISGALVGLRAGDLAHDIRARYREATNAAARAAREVGFQASNSTVHLGPLLWASTDPWRGAQRGDIVQFDSGVQLSGYRTDMGRTFTFGSPNDAQRRIEDALMAGFEAGLGVLKPGNRFCDVFHATQEAVRAAGFPSYARGHVGHSIGSDIDGEEWPWLSAGEERLIEPGMVLAFEVPYYVNGVGGFQNEDDLLITQDGCESFNALPHGLVAVGD